METPKRALEKITTFHGHGGPWAALGYRAGMLARRMLKPEKIKDIRADIKLRYEVPYSCFLDGIQVGSCCTVGKKNLAFSDMDTVPVSCFSDRNGKKLRIGVKPQILKEITPADDGKAAWILQQADDVLFSVEAVQIDKGKSENLFRRP